MVQLGPRSPNDALDSLVKNLILAPLSRNFLKYSLTHDRPSPINPEHLEIRKLHKNVCETKCLIGGDRRSGKNYRVFWIRVIRRLL